MDSVTSEFFKVYVCVEEMGNGKKSWTDLINGISSGQVRSSVGPWILERWPRRDN